MVSVEVRVDGLDDVTRLLQRVEHGLDGAGREAARESAEKAASKARSAAEARGGVAAKAAPSVRAEGGSLAVGGEAYPYAGGAAFGGQGRSTTQQFEPYRKGGYFPYPQIAAADPEETFADHIGALTERAGIF